MAKRDSRQEVAGGLGLLAAAAYLCVKGLRQVDKRLREKKK